MCVRGAVLEWELEPGLGLLTPGSGTAGVKSYITEKEDWGLNLWVPERGRNCAPRFLGLGCWRHKMVEVGP